VYRKWGFVVLAALVAAVGSAHAMTLTGDANIVELLQQSSDIVVGKVSNVTDGIDSRGVPYTEVTLQVSESIRGGISGTYTFRQFGLLAPRLTAEDYAALDAFDALAEDATLRLDMAFQPGDMQFVHNHTVLHDRTAFEDWPEPERKRHLLRLWLAAPGARELPPAYAERYGSVKIGDRGGIICKGTKLHAPLEPV